MRKVALKIVSGVLVIAVACVEPYKIGDTTYERVLVVESFISNIADNYFVTISTSSKLNTKEFIPEANAIVWVKSGSNDSISFSEIKPGRYQTTTQVAGVSNEKYILHFTTHDGKKYISNEVILKPVPPIDSVFAKFVDREGARGIQVLVSSTGGKTHSPFYRWQCVETYEVLAPWHSAYQWLGGNNVAMRQQRIDRCWPTDTIRNILITSASGLVQNSVTSFPLKFVSEDSYAFQEKYSILVKQYSLSESGYEFWNFMRKINETQGTFFDLQPGTVTGNIFSTSDPTEKVLGYFDASETDTVRAFFTPAQFASQSFTPGIYEAGCRRIQPELVPLTRLGAYFQYHSYDRYEITDAFGFFPDVDIAIVPRACCDCTYLGTNVKPSFWK